jgi:prolyl-tRNA synthetase
MRLSKSGIQTLREAPSNARTEGFAWLVRASYLTRENEITALGQRAISRLQRETERGQKSASLFHDIKLPIIETDDREIHFAIPTGKAIALQCSACQYAARKDLARFTKEIPLPEDKQPTEKVLTPNCYTIEALADFLNIPTKKTAKAIMLTRLSEKKLIFVVVRGDMQLSEAKLKKYIGDFQPATYEEISATGASAGFASPIGLKNALIVVDDLIPQSPNLVAGANEEGYHLLNLNYDRDYKAEIVADLVEANAGDTCPNCDGALELFKTDLIAETKDGKITLHPADLLQALAETHHDENGLTIPLAAAPYDIYLMVIPGRKMDTISVASELYEKLQNAGFSVLYDDRDTHAGVKFKDADLIGLPLRITLGERGLKEGNVEVKLRSAKEKELVALDAVVNYVDELLR